MSPEQIRELALKCALIDSMLTLFKNHTAYLTRQSELCECKHKGNSKCICFLPLPTDLGEDNTSEFQLYDSSLFESNLEPEDDTVSLKNKSFSYKEPTKITFRNTTEVESETSSAFVYISEYLRKNGMPFEKVFLITDLTLIYDPFFGYSLEMSLKCQGLPDTVEFDFDFPEDYTEVFERAKKVVEYNLGYEDKVQPQFQIPEHKCLYQNLKNNPDSIRYFSSD